MNDSKTVQFSSVEVSQDQGVHRQSQPEPFLNGLDLGARA